MCCLWFTYSKTQAPLWRWPFLCKFSEMICWQGYSNIFFRHPLNFKEFYFFVISTYIYWSKIIFFRNYMLPLPSILQVEFIFQNDSFLFYNMYLFNLIYIVFCFYCSFIIFFFVFKRRDNVFCDTIFLRKKYLNCKKGNHWPFHWYLYF